MNLLEVVLAITSLLSFGLAIFSFVRTEILKTKEKANVALMQEKLRSFYRGLQSLIHSTDAIVQIPKGRNVEVQELQNLARVTRGHGYVLMKAVQEYSGELKDWRFGVMIKSSSLEDLSQAQQGGEEA